MESKYFRTDKKVLLLGICKCYMKALYRSVLKLMLRLSFFKSRPKGDKKVLLLSIFKCNMKAVSPYVQKLILRLFFFRK